MTSQKIWLVLNALVLIGVIVFLIVRSRAKRSASQPVDSQFLTATKTTSLTKAPDQTDGSQSSAFGLAKSQSLISTALGKLFSSDSETSWIELEESLIMADTGVAVASNLVNQIKSAQRKSSSDLPDIARRILTQEVSRNFIRNLDVERRHDKPAVILVVGVNGTGKTTSVGKLAHWLTQHDRDVLLGAADTFRAAAADQLVTWGQRSGVPVVTGDEGADPASVAFEAANAGVEHDVDVVLIDTAGRLHTKQGLMDELGKVHRVVSKVADITEVLLVIDATTGQNGLMQAKVFSEVVPLTGIVLTKLDGTAKGGIVIAVQNELNVPVKFVGLGEGIDDLVPFDPATFVAGLTSAKR